MTVRASPPSVRTATPSVRTAMVMAAGLGTRMRPLTNDRPKALVEVAGRTLVDHMLDRLAAAGVTRAIVNVHHFADALESRLKTRTQPEILISDERAQLLETGGALVKARSMLGTDPIFVANSDSIWLDPPGGAGALGPLLAAWDAARMDALLLLAPLAKCTGFPGAGDFHRAGDGALRRPAPGEGAPFAYMGVQIFHPRLIDGFSEEPFSLNKMWDRALPQGRVCGVVYDGLWMHVGDPSGRDEAEARLAEGAA